MNNKYYCVQELFLMNNLPDIQALYQSKYLNSSRQSADEYSNNLVEKAKKFHRKIMSNFQGMKKVQCLKIVMEKNNMSHNTHDRISFRQKIDHNRDSHSSTPKQVHKIFNKNDYLRKILKLSQGEMTEWQHKMGGQRNLKHLLNTFYARKHKIQSSRQQNKQPKPFTDHERSHRYKLSNSQQKRPKESKSIDDQQVIQELIQTSRDLNPQRVCFNRKINEFRCSFSKNSHYSMNITSQDHNDLHYLLQKNKKIQKSKGNKNLPLSIKDKQLAPWSVIDRQFS